MLAHFEPEAVLVARDGRSVTDPIEIAAQLERDMSFGPPLEAKARHVFVAGDIAQIVVDWSIRGWTLAVPDRQCSWGGGATARLTRVRIHVRNDEPRGDMGTPRAGT